MTMECPDCGCEFDDDKLADARAYADERAFADLQSIIDAVIAGDMTAARAGADMLALGDSGGGPWAGMVTLAKRRAERTLAA